MPAAGSERLDGFRRTGAAERDEDNTGQARLHRNDGAPQHEAGPRAPQDAAPKASKNEEEGSVPVTEAAGERRGSTRNDHSAQPQPQPQPQPRSVTITIPVDQVVGAATAVARLPLNAARKVAPTRANGPRAAGSSASAV